MHACQLWSKYTQTSMNRLRIAYSNGYQINMHYILRNVSDRPHQVNHYVRTFDALFRNYLYGCVRRCESLQRSDAFYKSTFFLHYLTLLYDGSVTIAVIAGSLSWCLFSPALPMRSNLSLLCVSWCLMIFIFSKKRFEKNIWNVDQNNSRASVSIPSDDFSHLLHNLML